MALYESSISDRSGRILVWLMARRRRWQLGLLVGLALCTAHAVGDQPEGGGGNLTDIKQSQPSFYVRASCDHASGIYEEGDSLALKVKSEADAYLYVIYEQADGKRYLIFPNSGKPDNRVSGGEEVPVPGSDDLFRWTVTKPLGKEKVQVVASKKPINALSLPELQKSIFNPISDKAIKGAELELNQPGDNIWTEHSIEITTVPHQDKPRPAVRGRRVGLFIGVSDYRYGPQPLHFAVSDATTTGRTFQEVGGIPVDEEILLLNEFATKAAIEKAITKDLKNMTQPGDTIVIYFSGHGSQILDEPPGEQGHDEEDGLDELLCNYDCFTFDKLVEFAKRADDGTLEDKAGARLSSGS